MTRWAATARTAVVVLAGLLAGCGAGGAPAARDGQLVVLAAASLTDALTEVAEQFMVDHPDVSVVLSFAGSSALAAQITQGAPADVFVAANPQTMRTVSDAGLVDGEPAVLVTNTLQIAVPRDDPGIVTGLADLADPDRTVALCAPQVPCGAAAQAVFRAAGLTPAPDTLEQDVRGALSKVELGEVDAALVYRTDVLAAGDAVVGLDFPEAAGAVNDYPVAVLADARDPDAARAFVAHLRSPAGLEVLTGAGFARP